MLPKSSSFVITHFFKVVQGHSSDNEQIEVVIVGEEIIEYYKLRIECNCVMEWEHVIDLPIELIGTKFENQFGFCWLHWKIRIVLAEFDFCFENIFFSYASIKKSYTVKNNGWTVKKVVKLYHFLKPPLGCLEFYFWVVDYIVSTGCWDCKIPSRQFSHVFQVPNPI